MTFSRFQTTVGQTGTVQQGQGCWGLCSGQ
jgi:hypothetical protein